MTDRRLDDRQRAQAALRRLSRPDADPVFRDRLGRRFAEGDLPPVARRPRGRGLPLLVGAAAVLLVVASLRLLSPPDPGWQVVNPEGAGRLEVEGVALSPSAAGSRPLRPGTRVRATESDVELVVPGLVALQLTPGTELTLPGVPRRPGGRDLAAWLVGGEARITSGPGWAGRRLRVRTPEAQVEVTGTTLAVIRDSTATCVCVFEGSVRMGDGASLAPVREGTRRSVYRDGRPPFTEEILAMERMKLDMLRDRGSELLGTAESP